MSKNTQKNIAKDSSTLLLSNGSTISVKDVKATKPEVKIDPVTGEFTISGDISVSQTSKSFDKNKGISVEFTYSAKDYQEEFKEKKQALHDIVEDGDGLRRDEVADLVEVANFAVWQKSKDT